MRAIGTVRELWRYPVSSMGGERLDAATVEARGVAGDRLWGVVDTRDEQVAAPEKRRHWRPLPNLFSRLRGDRPEIGLGDGLWLDVASDEAEALVSSHLDLPTALRPHVDFGTEREGHVAPRYQRADLHILTTASLDRLAELLHDPHQADSRRFRPNIVIETTRGFTGLVEHELVGSALGIGDVRIRVSEPCARCSFTALSQGELAFEPGVLQRIAQHGKGGFGVLCAVEATGRIAVGDEVRLLSG